MSLKVPSSNGPQLFKSGFSFSSGLEEAVLKNIQAVCQVSDLVRTSFGPHGHNKIIINHLEKTFVTNDAATILRELEVVHPAGKVLVLASQQQEAEVGDRTNLVLIFAGELLKRAEPLLMMGLHPSEIIRGYELGREKALEILPSLECQKLDMPLSADSLAIALRPALASKQYGQHEKLAELVAEACLLTLPQDEPSMFNVDSVRVVKILGGSLSQSRVVRGMVFNRQPETSIKSAKRAKVAVYTCGIDISQTETKGTVLLKSADELLGFSKGEEKHMQAIFQQIADSGVKVIVAGSSVGELALHFLNRLNILVIRVLSKFDLRRLCKVVDATPLARLGAPIAEEMGFVDVVETIEIGGDRVTVFRQEEDETKTRTATVVLRGATTNQMDDLERAVDDGVNVVKGAVKDQRLVPGAGATELEIGRQVQEYGDSKPGITQHAIKAYGEAFEVIARTLAENAGLDSTDVLSRLYAAHANGKGVSYGVDVEGESNGILETKKAGVVDLLGGTEWGIKYATQAAVTILQVDSIIMSKASGIAPPKQNPNWDED